MYRHLFDESLKGENTLQVYEKERLIFGSTKEGLLPLLKYLDRFTYPQGVVIFDRIIGRAAALLCVKANCCEVYSPLDSQLAIETLEKYGIKHYFTKVVPYIQKPDSEEMCPIKKLSLGKEPEEFYKAVRRLVSKA